MPEESHFGVEEIGSNSGSDDSEESDSDFDPDSLRVIICILRVVS